jgi:thioredoxin 1
MLRSSGSSKDGNRQCKKETRASLLILNLKSEDITVLQTNLEHLETDEETEEALKNNENVVICCGRMGPMCIPVYAILSQLESQYPHVHFYDQDFDIPAARFIRRLPECAWFRGLPFTVYFKNSKVVAATTSIQNSEQICKILDEQFGRYSQA